MHRLASIKHREKRDKMYDIEKAKQYAWEQSDWIAHSNGYFLMKDCVFFYHKGDVVFGMTWTEMLLTILSPSMARTRWTSFADGFLQKKNVPLRPL